MKEKFKKYIPEIISMIIPIIIICIACLFTNTKPFGDYLLAKYDATRVPGFNFYKASNLKITFNTPLKKAWCIDGEELTPIDNSYEIKINNNIKILMPTKNIDKLFINKNTSK